MFWCKACNKTKVYWYSVCTECKYYQHSCMSAQLYNYLKIPGNAVKLYERLLK